MRKFETGSSRDSDKCKLKYCDYTNPLTEYSFAKYMETKQRIDWEYRSGRNRQLWIPIESLYDSLIRHVEILKLLREWYRVFEYKDKDWVTYLEVKPDWFTNKDWREEKTITNELNAIHFNQNAMLLHYIKQDLGLD